MTIVSMKTDDGDSYEIESSAYGYGLEICLSEDQVEALGLNLNPPKAGSKVGIRGLAFVCAVTTEANAAEGDTDVRLRLQITDLEVTPAGAGTQTDAASLLYGE